MANDANAQEPEEGEVQVSPASNVRAVLSFVAKSSPSPGTTTGALPGRVMVSASEASRPTRRSGATRPFWRRSLNFAPRRSSFGWGSSHVGTIALAEVGEVAAVPDEEFAKRQAVEAYCIIRV